MEINTEQFNRISEGNPGALTVMFELTRTGRADLIAKLDNLGITGHKIWMLYKDECGEDLAKFIEAVEAKANAER